MRERREPELYNSDYSVKIAQPLPKKKGARGYPYFRITFIDPSTGVLQERSGGRTGDEAHRRAAELVAELDAGAPVESARRSTHLERATQIWLNDAPHPRWSDRNREEHASRLRCHVLPLLGSRRMGSLAPADMRKVLEAVQEKGLARDTINNVGRTMGAFAKWARSENYCARDLMDGISVADYSNPNADDDWDDEDELEERGGPVITADMCPSQEAWMALAAGLRASKVPWMGLATEVAATTAIRYGELAALTPKVFDFDGGYFWVRRALVCPSRKPASWKPTKNRTRRRVPIPPYLEEELRERCAVVEADPKNPESLLFTNMGGTKMPVQNFHNLALQDALDKVKDAGVWDRRWTWKDLRHTAITWWLMQPPVGLGLEEVYVSQYAGHSDTAFTRRRYVGVLGEAAEAGRAAMEGFVPAGR